ATAGISPNSAIEVVDEENDEELAIGTLVNANLAIVINRGTVVLTSADSIGQTHNNSLVKNVASHVVDDALEGRPIVPFAAWVHRDRNSASPWVLQRSGGNALTGGTNWSTTHVAGDRTDGHSVFLVHSASITTLRWTLFLLMVVAATVWLPKRPTSRLGLLVALAVLALILNPLIAPLATSLLLGLVVAMILRAVRSSNQSTIILDAHSQSLDPDIYQETTQTVRVPDLALLFIAVTLAASGTVIARQPEADSNPTQVIFIPVGPDQKDVSDTVYVPEPFFKKLHRLAPSYHNAPSGWMISGGHYRGQLEWNSEHDRVTIANLTASFSVDVLARNVSVRIPLSAVGAESVVKVDGKPVTANI
ncbi:MAG: hypothetical protein N2C12_04975, partial [Planctomycetales bacterium]